MHSTSVGENRDPAQRAHRRLLLGAEARSPVCIYGGPLEYRAYVTALIWSGRSQERGARAADWLRGFVNKFKEKRFFKFVTLQAEENNSLQLREKKHTQSSSRLLLFAFYPASVWTFLI